MHKFLLRFFYAFECWGSGLAILYSRRELFLWLDRCS